MELDGDSDNPRDEIVLWSEVLDFVDRLAMLLGLSGCSLGILAGDAIHTYNRGFADHTSRQYAVLPVDADLPGPATLRMRWNQFFPTRTDAHRRYPEAAGIDGGTRHEAAATLVLEDDEPRAIGYLAMHFAASHSFDEAERQQLARLAASVVASLPVSRVVPDPPAADSWDPASSNEGWVADGSAGQGAVVHAMRAYAALSEARPVGPRARRSATKSCITAEGDARAHLPCPEPGASRPAASGQ